MIFEKVLGVTGSRFDREFTFTTPFVLLSISKGCVFQRKILDILDVDDICGRCVLVVVS